MRVEGGYRVEMKLRKTFYAFVGFVAVAVGKRVVRRKVRRALRIS
jgi:hypothetical protein